MASRKSFATALLGLVFLISLPANATRFICRDGSPLVCSDGSTPIIEDLQDSFGRPDLNIRSLCPPSCNIYRNSCDPTTAPTCIYPDPRAKNPRAACACRPGYKASDTADGDTQKQWRLPVAGQEHRVWVAEGVKCDARCVGYGAQSCTEVALLGPDCIGDGAGAKPGGDGYGTGDSPPYSPGAGPRDGSISGDASPTVIYVPSMSSSYDDGESTEGTAISYPSDASYTSADSDAYTESTYAGSDTYARSDSYTRPDTYSEGQPTKGQSYQPTASQDPSSSWEIPGHLEVPASTPGSAAGDGNIDMPRPFEVPDIQDQVQRRDDSSDAWKLSAQRKGWQIYLEQWDWLIDKLTGVRDEFPMDERPALCPTIRTWVNRACTRGIEIQNDNCVLGNGADPKCLTFGVDTQCCANYERQDPSKWCRGGQTWSNLGIEQRRKDMQDTCLLVTAGGKSAVKLYLSLGLVDSLLRVMKEGEDPIPFMAKVTEAEGKWSTWARGIGQLVAGKVQDGLGLLAEIKPRVSDKGQNGVAWSEALEPVILDEVDDFMLKSTHVAYDVYVVMREREFIIQLLNGEQFGKSLGLIKGVANRYALDAVQPLVPSAFDGFNKVKDGPSFDAAVEEYRALIGTTAMLNVARAWAVVLRINRLLGSS